MGKRKANNARLRKEAKAERAFAYLRNCPIATRKVRLVADMVRGVEVNRALHSSATHRKHQLRAWKSC